MPSPLDTGLGVRPVTYPHAPPRYDFDNESGYRRAMEDWTRDAGALLADHSRSITLSGGYPIIPSTGRWYRNSVHSAAGITEIDVVADRVYYTPFVFNRDAAFDGLAFEVRAQGQAGATGRVGVYTNNYDLGLAPDKLLVQSGDLDCTTSGVKEFILPQPLTLLGGVIFWFAGVWDDATIDVYGYDPDNTFPLGAATSGDALSVGASTHAFEDIGAWTEMPAQAGTVTWGAAGAEAPAFVLRVA